MHKLTFSTTALLKDFILEKEELGRSPRTIDWYRLELRLCTEYLAAQGIDLQDATTDVLRAYFAELRTHRRLISVNTSFRAVRGFYNWLVSEEILTRNPCKGITTPHETVVKPIYKLAELQKVLDAVTDTHLPYRDTLILSLLIETGLRANELVKLETAEIDGEFILLHGKGQKQRQVRMSKAVRKALRKYLLHERPGLDPEDLEDRLLLGDEGEPLTYWGVRQLLRRIKHKTGIADLHCHKFRHTFATIMAGQVKNASELQGLLGHSSISTSVHYINQNALQESMENVSVLKVMEKQKRKK